MDRESVNIQAKIEQLYPYLDTEEHFIVGMLTEEAGEVQGAFNKARRSNVPLNKRMNTRDIVGELIQLYACVLLAGYHYGLSVTDMSLQAESFMNKKWKELSEDAWKGNP